MTRKSDHRLERPLRAALFAGVATFAFVGPAHAGSPDQPGVQRPVAADFGIGPRASAKSLYTASLKPYQPLRLRQLQTVVVHVVDAAGRPVEGARIAVDGGMPEHSHGLPTQPRVRRAVGPGLYEIEGLRFSMRGWWELKLTIEAAAGADRVTFNISL